MEKVLCVPDMHLPATDWDSVNLIYASIESLKPTVVIQLGDLYDAFSFSKFPHKLDMSPKEELAEARLGAENFWKQIRKQCGSKTRFIQLLGNHDVRPSKRIIEKLPEIAEIISLDHLWKFEGVETILDTRCEFQIDGVIYTHGHYTLLGKHCQYYLRSVVHGHTHRGATFFMKINPYGSREPKNLFELDCGYLANEKDEMLTYTATKTTRWTLGFGFVDELGPRFIPI